MADLVPVRRALISVSDKTGLAEFATLLHKTYGVTLLSTGGTAKFLRDAGLPVTDVADVTGFPEMMDGRVKTLHPKIHGGLLALRDDEHHVASMKAHGIEPIDLVIINLYPFKPTIEKPGVTFEEAIENIDIGGPSMVRSAAKNHRFVAVVTSPDQYEKVTGDLAQHNGSTCGKHRLKLAQKAFQHTHEYDGMIASYLAKQLTTPDNAAAAAADETDAQPEETHNELAASSVGNKHVFLTGLVKRQDLRYGENPHQRAALYGYDDPIAGHFEHLSVASIASARQRHGKELSYINLLDADAAVKCVSEFHPDQQAAVCIVKHATPCGVGCGQALAAAFAAAYDSDPLAAFGGIVACNRDVDEIAATSMTQGNKFLEVIAAPAFTDEAIAILSARWKNVRLLDVGPVKPLAADGGDFPGDAVTYHQILGGLLVQERDGVGVVESEWKIVSQRAPTDAERAAMRIAWLACKHVKSNAIVLARDSATVGIGGGQVDRVGAAGIAIAKAGDRAGGAVAASDAFFPFPDGPKRLLDAGATAIIQPGGSVRDQETIDLVNARNAAMIFTGRRHFRH